MPPDTRPHRDQHWRGRCDIASTIAGATKICRREKVLHTRGFRFGGDLGLSALGYARETIGAALATEEAAARMYAQGMRAVRRVYRADRDVRRKPDFKKNYVEPFEGAKGEGGSLVLPPGFDFKAHQSVGKGCRADHVAALQCRGYCALSRHSAGVARPCVGRANDVRHGRAKHHSWLGSRSASMAI
jgi:phage portal protein BeeE